MEVLALGALAVVGLLGLIYAFSKGEKHEAEEGAVVSEKLKQSEAAHELVKKREEAEDAAPNTPDELLDELDSRLPDPSAKGKG